MKRKSLLASGEFIAQGELPPGVLCAVFLQPGGGPAVLLAQMATEVALACVAAIAAKNVGVERAEEVVRKALRGD